tara:strand:+ start:2083 stop:3882 length:1800 start_codon:yes stop_codon:yes gene_type:complete
MATHDYVIANGSGAAVRSDLNNALAAIVSNNSSSTEPATTYAYQWWADTNASLLKLRNSANSAWITVRALDGALTVADGSAASPSITFSDDTNTGAFSGASDQFGIATAGVERFNVKTTEVVVNDPSNDVNFRVESNNAANMLFVDGGNDRVGINEGSPDAHLHVNSGSTDVVAKFESTDAGAAIELVDSDATSKINQVGAALEISSDSGDADANSVIKLVVDGSAKATVDSSGRLLLGTTTSVGPANRLQIAGTGENSAAAQIIRNSADTGGPIIDLVKSRNASHGSFTAVQDDDTLGTIRFRGDDGADYLSVGASISAAVDASPGANDLPGRLVFSTTADEGNSPSERARINKDGYFKSSNAADYVSVDQAQHEFNNNHASNNSLTVRATHSSFAGTGFTVGIKRSSSQLYDIVAFYSGNGTNAYSDTEYRFRGDGSAFADGDWNTGGADYAENFEWSDGNSSNEDRRGISVVLVGDKIREAAEGEDPIGVISGNPSVVGDSDGTRWAGKYLRDDYGTYLSEDYEATDDEGNTVTQKRRVLNPDFDPSLEHVEREFRPEWSPVGLMGKLRIRKGQVTGARWIKMRDVSATVEEWLVR